ncbi:diacylglycerol kinase family protein [Cohnella pontilimi]|uniref:Diacylglycerol kinase family protein n=2 Tax=Cohnella pontilimi TaxID=2564100 RepID=A0A4U0FFG8_9BACL|nr:diacylglycerol kinase family protein [Cohnella pontilimi]
MRFHVGAAIAAAAAGIWLRIPAGGWLWLGAAVSAVWTTELINTAVERTVDLATPERHPLAKAAKDAAAGAVLVAASFAVFVGLVVLAPPLCRLLFG